MTGRPYSIDGTRSSAEWASLPGNYDRLNTRAIYPSSNQWGIPDVPASLWVPDHLVTYNAQNLSRIPGAAFHFFLDDYRFETVWNRPEQMLTRIGKQDGALSPDFSIWADMPWVMQVWQIYRSRWCQAFWADNGIKTIPTVSWSTKESYTFAFAGIPQQSVVAVSTVGISKFRQLHKAFMDGYTAMFSAINPPVVLVYGAPLPDMQGNLRVYPASWRVKEQAWAAEAAREAAERDGVTDASLVEAVAAELSHPRSSKFTRLGKH